ncbi:hypothetical protein [Sphingomonas fennica]|uniref:Uncharacterized protein n=1 Tax=Edaphosphingomonas fennica TaxID=114404 RepID=A0A2T4I4T1_9SPHN|nr:hypothetical protein [Sphingomonas fennica]PTD24759.1 hypothetical protein CV103_06980 [Sphingomonas fennica]
MPASVVIVDLFGLLLAVIGFTMAFRQHVARRLLGRPLRPATRRSADDDEDPLTYVLRIAGVMVMVFGVVIAGMVTLIHLR